MISKKYSSVSLRNLSDPYDPSNYFEFYPELGTYDICELDNELVDSIKSLKYTKVIRREGRLLDSISYSAYTTESLWWVLLIYNEIIDPYQIDKENIYIPSLGELDTILSSYLSKRSK